MDQSRHLQNDDNNTDTVWLMDKQAKDDSKLTLAEARVEQGSKGVDCKWPEQQDKKNQTITLILSWIALSICSWSLSFVGCVCSVQKKKRKKQQKEKHFTF